MKIYGKLYNSLNKNYFVTTPIYYVNAAPHIGHLYSSVIADAIQRWFKLKDSNNSVLFSTGTDEHGTKIQQAAANHKTSISDYCYNISNQYKSLSQLFNIDYTNFIRTTDAKHKETVQHFWNVIDKNGYIYSAKYSGWYCVSDETFLSESQLKEKRLPDGRIIKVSVESSHPVEWSEETNYVFRLSSLQDDLKYWLNTNKNCVKPEKFYKILCELVESDALNDVSISRPVSRVHWGIPVPGNPSQSIYVWLDALVNYLTVSDYPDSKKFQRFWPPSVQVIGKDILKFHGVYWPAFLMAAKLEPPKTLLCHSHWTVDDQKMSKSKNNCVCPFDKLQEYTAEGLRYFLLREGVAHSDGNYSDVKVVRILNSELADTLGNLLSRCTGKSLNPEQEFPAFNREIFEKIFKEDCTKKLLDNLNDLPEKSYFHYENFNFYKVIDSVLNTLFITNNFFETMKPWQLKKSEVTKNDLLMVLFLTLESLKICGIILQPVLPTLSDTLLNKLNVPKNERFWKCLQPFSWNVEKFEARKFTNVNSILFKRILNENDKRRKINV